MGYVIANSHRIRSIWAPPSTPPRLLRRRGTLSVTSSSTRCWRGHGGRWHPANTARAEAGVDGSGAAQGDLVRVLLRHAVAGDWPAVRHPVRHAVHAVRPRLWRRLLNRLILAWRQACGDKLVPSAVIIDSPLSLSASEQLSGESSCHSAPTCFGRGFDGGKKIKGIKIHLAVDKYGFPLAIHVSAANMHDSKGIVPVLHQLAGFKGTALGDLSYRGERLAGEALGITLQPSADGGTFIPEGIRVERSLAWISRYLRLNTIFERGHLVAFIEIAFISILSRRLVRLVTQEISA
jgi:hypothetical protein